MALWAAGSPCALTVGPCLEVVLGAWGVLQAVPSPGWAWIGGSLHCRPRGHPGTNTRKQPCCQLGKGHPSGRQRCAEWGDRKHWGSLGAPQGRTAPCAGSGYPHHRCAVKGHRVTCSYRCRQWGCQENPGQVRSGPCWLGACQCQGGSVSSGGSVWDSAGSWGLVTALPFWSHVTEQGTEGQRPPPSVSCP